MNNVVIKEYSEYANKIGDRKSLYKTVTQEYNIKIAAYPGSHIDIAPSLIIPRVTYIDNFKGAIKFFKDIVKIKEYIDKNKEYKEESEIEFIGQDYRNPLMVKKVDLLISQYAGFVGQDTKEILKVGGILLANDSHGDASLAYLDEDFEFIGVINERNEIKYTDLSKYFILPRKKHVKSEQVKEKMKGLNYKLKADNYLFRKVK